MPILLAALELLDHSPVEVTILMECAFVELGIIEPCLSIVGSKTSIHGLRSRIHYS